MVRTLLCLMLLPLSLMALGNINVSADLGDYSIAPNRPLNASLVITHPIDQKIEESSIIMEGKPLKVSLVKKVPLGEGEVIEIYSFTLPARKAGEYLLSPVSVKIGDTVYSSMPVRFIVPDEGPASNEGGAEEPFLGLEVEVDNPSGALYPGRRFTLKYRYVYRGEVQLTREELPLLKAEGFTKVGEERVTDYIRNGDSVREVLLELQANEPGTFRFAQSVIEGTGYYANAPPRTLRAVAEPITITVLPFPRQQQPVAFDGAQGEFEIQAQLVSPESVRVGDKVLLALTIKGKSESLINVKLPKLLCQPSFAGLFTIDDLPVPGEVVGESKRFVVPIRPTNDLVTEIPPIFFSFYNPQKSDYQTIHTKAIPLRVEAVANVRATGSLDKLEGRGVEDWNQELAFLRPISEKELTLLGNKDLRNVGAGSWSVLWIIPVGFGALIGQYEWKRRSER